MKTVAKLIPGCAMALVIAAAAKLLEKIPPEKQKTSRWWTEKSSLIRQFLADKEYQAAYNIAKNHYLTKGADFADAEWTAGWIALRNLKKRKQAVQHFKNMLQSVSSRSAFRAANTGWAELMKK